MPILGWWAGTYLWRISGVDIYLLYAPARFLELFLAWHPLSIKGIFSYCFIFTLSLLFRCCRKCYVRLSLHVMRAKQQEAIKRKQTLVSKWNTISKQWMARCHLVSFLIITASESHQSMCCRPAALEVSTVRGHAQLLTASNKKSCCQWIRIFFFI